MHVSLKVGAKQKDSQGVPIEIAGRLRTLSDGVFIEPSPRHGGHRENAQGLTAVVETDQRHSIVLTSLRMAPLSLHQILSLGIYPQNKKLIIVKAVVAPRVAYAAVADHFILADTPGATSSNLASYEYQHRQRPMFPYEPDAEYPTSLS